ncbi:hypothetical protein KAR52_02170 [Candidatus Pacearchaeota archaeon]|nr:hypothetical protein [Candidatus Pacearchaeota archaeon]
MIKNQKNVFWQALILTGIVFVIGLVLGSVLESNRLDEINDYYAQSEVSLMDILALNNLIDLEDTSCDILVDANFQFADKIYEEALLLEKYGDSEKMDDNFKFIHKKYDLLRTFLWINSIKSKERCDGDFSTVIYLYEYDSKDLTKKATQIVWSRILSDLKQEKGNEILLIPIAINSDVTSLNYLIEDFEISKFPVVIVNEEHIISELSSVEDIAKYLD